MAMAFIAALGILWFALSVHGNGGDGGSPLAAWFEMTISKFGGNGRKRLGAGYRLL